MGIGGFFKSVVTAPVKGVKAVKRKAERKVKKEILLLLVRHGLTAIGAGGALSNDEITQIAGALAVAAGLLWSGWRKVKRARDD